MDEVLSVCICTYRRPDGLRRLLTSLQQIDAPDGVREVEIVVVDNSPTVDAKELVEEFGASRFTARFVHEPRPGIPQARNHAVSAARGTLIAFIDDDEVPAANWLHELVSVARRFNADLVAGPVIPLSEGGQRSWAIEEGFLDRQRHPTGTIVPFAGTGNLLVRRTVLDSLHPAFDERLALTGGSDALFALRATRAGNHIVWADDALVYEYLPVQRLAPKWLIRRSFRQGASRALLERMVYPGWKMRALRALQAARNIAAGGGRLVMSGFGLRRVMALKAIRLAAGGLGMLWGLSGRSYEEYRRTKT